MTSQSTGFKLKPTCNRVLAAHIAGAALLLSASPADAQPVPDVGEAFDRVVAETTPRVQAAPIGQNERARVENTAALVRSLRPFARPDELLGLEFRRTSNRRSVVTLERIQQKQVLIAGGVFERRRFPGFNGVQDYYGDVYSTVVPYLVSPSFVGKQRTTIQAVTRAGRGWRTISNTVELPDEADGSITALSTKPIPADYGSDRLLFRDAVPGYAVTGACNCYRRTLRANARLTLASNAPRGARKATFIKITQSLSKTPGSKRFGVAAGKQPVGTRTEIRGPFRRTGELTQIFDGSSDIVDR